MDFSGCIFIFDLHNTLYDEVSEYSGAVSAALDVFHAAARQQGIRFNPDEVCKELSEAHARCGSDWDDAAWDDIAYLRALPDFERVRDEAIALRRQVSETLTRQGGYTGVQETLAALKNGGAAVYIATEATENALAAAAGWLELGGLVDGAYAWPFRKSYEEPDDVAVRRFPAHPDDPSLFLEKPHPLIVGVVLLAEAQRRGIVPMDVTAEDVFVYGRDEVLDLSTLEAQLAMAVLNDHHARQARQAVEAMRTTLDIAPGPYQEALMDLRGRCFYVGDSFFKDGLLARNAGVPFIFAAYGKKEADTPQQKTARAMLYAVTGWNRFLLTLTQEAGNLPALSNIVAPALVCDNGIKDILTL